MTKTALEQATENMRLSKSMFDNGMETLSDYLEAQVLWQQANEEHITAGFNRYVSYIDYQRTIGAL
jgi:outer membrane protein TolC